jgi:DNA repair exonuclease SbcCD ATPase subunit
MKTAQKPTIDPHDPPTFEKVWMMFQESERRMQEADRRMQEADRQFKKQMQENDKRMKEADRRLKEQMAETARQMKETDRQMKETDRQMKETDRRLKEQMAEADRRLKEQMAETDKQIKETGKQMKETDKKVGELTNRFGTMVEHMVVPNLLAKFKALGFTFEVAHKNTEIKDEKNKIFMELDAMLENGDKVMVVEIKSTPTIKDVNEHIVRMEKLRKHVDRRRDTRKYLGAIAGVVTSESVKTHALKQGFFVIVPSGDTFDIIKPEGKYQIREW